MSPLTTFSIFIIKGSQTDSMSLWVCTIKISDDVKMWYEHLSCEILSCASIVCHSFVLTTFGYHLRSDIELRPIEAIWNR